MYLYNGYCHCNPTANPRWSCHHCICPEKQLLHQKGLGSHRDSGHFFVGTFLRFFVWEIASIPSSKSLLHHFFRKKKSMKIFDLKVDRWKWCPILPQLLWQLGILTGMTPSRAKQHPPRKMEEMSWAETAGCHWKSSENLNLPWTFWILHMKQNVPAALSRMRQIKIHVGIVVWRSYHLSNLPKTCLCAPAPFCIHVFSNFCTFRENSSTWIKGYNATRCYW